ncbi:hypothetical protein EYZ11_005342 [Aspergillus tanneri]|uniref:Pre-mRNA splicing factor CLF1 n=1 Tax=Aspergillus tanneri TaxID=1220188 RepID=A0A4S3JIE9_9EURO|nr:hypothetical protein EYZ11_005342 [Aspergillus tanneri]
MIVPKPPVKLEGHCSVIHDNTLYTYSANGFASIPLERNGTWTELTMGEPVSNAACVTGGVDGKGDQQAFYVDKKWKSFEPSRGDMANRTSHSAVYLESSSSILVYGGHQTHQTDASSATFVINTADPYNISSFEASKASPVYHPILLPWSDKEAALVGGITDKKQVYLFDPVQGWRSSHVRISKELPDQVRCAIVSGSDESKILEAFDMSTSPNTVTSETLLMSAGKPALSKSKSRTKRITIDDYPKYDDSLASSTKRQDYSLAQGGNQVVISSGSGTDTLAIFNQTSNSWVNATKLFYGDKPRQQILPTTTTSSGPSATATESGATTSPAAGSKTDNSNVGTVLGATLGSILGVAALLIVIILLLKRKKNAMKRAAQAQNGGDKDRLSFQDQGVEPLTQSAYPMAKGPAPLAATSMDSLAIFAGNVGDEKSRSTGVRPPPATKPPLMKPSPLSIHSDGELTAVASPRSMDKAIEAQSPGDRRTDEGWGRYFQDNSAVNLASDQTPQAPFARSDDRASQVSQWPVPHLTPLNMGLLDEPKPLGRVVTGSPTTEHASSPKDGRYINIPESQSARISSASSISATSDDDYERRDGLSNGIQDPNGHYQHSWMGRPPSSTYSRSMYNPSMYNPSPRDMPSMPPQSAHEPGARDTTASTNTRGSSVLIPDNYEHMPPSRDNINSDMSWLNLHAER